MRTETRMATARPGPWARNERSYFGEAGTATRLPSTGASGRCERIVLLAQFAVVVAVGEIDDEPDDHPDDQAVPVLDRQRKYQQQTRQDTQDRDERDHRRAERTVGIRIRPAHHDDG